MDPKVYRRYWVKQRYLLDPKKTVLAPDIDMMFANAMTQLKGHSEAFRLEYYRTMKNRLGYDMYYIYPKHILYNYRLYESLKPEIEEFDKSELKNPWRKIKSARK